MSDVLERFAVLFDGRKDAWGTGDGPVERGHLSWEHYSKHLDGQGSGLGIFPMLDDNTVRFAAIDLDEPDFELARTMQKLIPGQSWIERSRSGNAHVWVFFEGACPAWAARAVLRGATEAVGRPDVEIFPKQDGLRKGGVGNFINLPYHGDDRPILAQDGPGHEFCSPEEFITVALSCRQDPDAWARRARTLGAKPPEEREASAEFGTSPVLHRCAQKIIRERESNPVTPGHRHQVLFHLAVQCLNYRDFSDDEAREWIEAVNDAAPKPLGAAELDRLFTNAVEGRFTFTGCDDPVMAPYVDPECPIAKGDAGR